MTGMTKRNITGGGSLKMTAGQFILVLVQRAIID
mgnify:FL=1